MGRPRLAALLRAAAAVLAAGTALAAQAHDTWLVPARAPSPAGQLALELATGNRYPRAEYPTSVASVKQARCVDGEGAGVPLAAVQAHDTWLDMAAPGAPLACGVDLHLAEVALDDAHVGIYFQDIHASPGLRAAWEALRAQGLPWRERYRKNARIELAAAAQATPAARARARQPLGLPLEFVLLGDEPVQVHRPIAARLLRGGQPLAGQPVELVSERNPLGIWQRTDAQGMLRVTLPFGGRWVLRSVDVRPTGETDFPWQSDFATLVVEAS